MSPHWLFHQTQYQSSVVRTAASQNLNQQRVHNNLCYLELVYQNFVVIKCFDLQYRKLWYSPNYSFNGEIVKIVSVNWKSGIWFINSSDSAICSDSGDTLKNRLLHRISDAFINQIDLLIIFNGSGAKPLISKKLLWVKFSVYHPLSVGIEDTN